MTNFFYYDLPLGRMIVVENDAAISQIFFTKKEINFPAPLRETPLIREASSQLAEYFIGKRKVFDFPLAPEGTAFQKQVWQALRTIPYGQTRSYKQIAAQVGNDKAARAIGQAANRNPIAIVVPCHRVIGADGSLTGFYGGLELKEKLLNLEKQY